MKFDLFCLFLFSLFSPNGICSYIKAELFAPRNGLNIFFCIKQMLHKPFELDLESEYSYMCTDNFEKQMKDTITSYETSSIFIRDKLLQGKRFRDDWQMEGIGGDTVNSYLMMHSL